MSTPKPLPPFFKQYNVLTNLTGSFLNARDLVNLSQTCKQFQPLFKKMISEHKKVSEHRKLLRHVFNADPINVKEFFSQHPDSLLKPSSSSNPLNSNHVCIILRRTSCDEEFYSPSLKKMMVKRTWSNISPLEAAALSGDNFLVKDLLKYVPEAEKKEAANQLQCILDRKETEENGVYLAPLLALHIAYDEYLQFGTNDVWPFDNQKKYWEQLWECQTKLSTYVLQEYSDEAKCFFRLGWPAMPPPPPPYPFQAAPKRDPQIYTWWPYGKNPLDLATSATQALYKASCCSYKLIKGFPPEDEGGIGRHDVYNDSLGMRRLYEVRKKELTNVIIELQSDYTLHCELSNRPKRFLYEF